MVLDQSVVDFFRVSPWAKFFFTEDLVGKMKYFTRFCRRINNDDPIGVAAKIEGFNLNDFEE